LNYKSQDGETTSIPVQDLVLRDPLQACFLFLLFLPSYFVASWLMGIDYLQLQHFIFLRYASTTPADAVGSWFFYTS
jgi:hypothetical protein